MPLHLREASLHDIPGMTVAGVNAFENDEINIAMFPHGPNPTPDRHRGDRLKFRAWMTLDRMAKPGWVSMVVVDDEKDGQIAGYAQWTKPAPPEGQEPDPPAVTKEEAASAAFEMDEHPPSLAEGALDEFWAAQKVEEDRVLGEGGKKDVWYLVILAVDPAYQGRGVGKILVQWGIDKAKAQGKGIFLSATPAGKPFYKRMGLQDAGAFEIWGTPETSFVLPR
ncbi:Acyl-CoA N-acyltransferase [Coniochaeta hoffmannii]|uniref:Acyl-CoA N-acyltransferase n=1 Tax=Coniochaeta hoffmannii TaxID=91930 RepID=A0AA38VT60_9PEZI|nr:Acyl-CoA N-acyltransferase [Coniochaeta hoffmannii]